MSKFYTFTQNNSGGFYLYHYETVIVEADNLEEAESIAERESDVYCGMGPHDCECCGPRWWYPYGDDDCEDTAGVASWREATQERIRIIRK